LIFDRQQFCVGRVFIVEGDLTYLRAFDDINIKRSDTMVMAEDLEFEAFGYSIEWIVGEYEILILLRCPALLDQTSLSADTVGCLIMKRAAIGNQFVTVGLNEDS
jgi:hypothetical protein